jgi:uridine kinase
VIDLAALVGRAPPCNGRYVTVAVDGRGGSGKTALADFLVERLPQFDVIHGDDYFEPHDDPVTWGEFNEARFDADLLAPLRAGNRPLRVRPFDFPRGQIGPEVVLPVGAGVVVERCFTFAMNVAWDVRVWVETPPRVCLVRGMRRDGAGVLGDRARLAWEQVWQPLEDAYLRRTSPLASADVVVDGTRPFEAQFG